MKILFLKLFEKLENEGQTPFAIISYCKQEFELDIQDCEEVVISYRYLMEINLWFVILRFNWTKYTN